MALTQRCLSSIMSSSAKTAVGINDIPVIAYVNTLLPFDSDLIASLCASKQPAGSYDLLPEELGH